MAIPNLERMRQKIKMLKLTGNTQSSQGSPISIPHGLNANNIISVEVLVWASPYFIPHSYTVSPGYEYHYAVGANTIEVFNKAGNSANILSKPLKILITYEEG